MPLCLCPSTSDPNSRPPPPDRSIPDTNFASGSPRTRPLYHNSAQVVVVVVVVARYLPASPWPGSQIILRANQLGLFQAGLARSFNMAAVGAKIWASLSFTTPGAPPESWPAAIISRRGPAESKQREQRQQQQQQPFGRGDSIPVQLLNPALGIFCSCWPRTRSCSGGAPS